MRTPVDGDSSGGRSFPARYTALLLVGSACVVGWGLIQHSKFWLGLAFASIAANLVFVVIARRRLSRPPSSGRLTGLTVSPQPPTQVASAPSAVPSITTRWVGGANVPGALGRMNATAPLGVLELSDGSLTLRIRPRFLAGMFGTAEAVTVSPADVEDLFPAKGQLRSPGIGLQVPGKPVLYFWTHRRQEILTALAAARFPVTWDERRFTY
jgi:hypothetical protein